MSEWKECKLGEIVIFQRGYDITQKEQIPGIFPVVSSSGIKSFHNQFKVNGPGVVIGRKGTLGTVFYLGKDFWPHDTTLWVKDFKGNYPNFVYYFLKTFGFENYDVGSSNPTLNRNHIHKLCALLPTLPEQKHIASILRSLDDKIDLLHRQNATLEAMAETLFRQWFVEEAKEDWSIRKLDDFVFCYNGVSYKSDDLNPSQTAMVTLKSFERTGGFRIDGFKEFTGKYKEQHIVKEGDLVVAHTDITQEADVIGNPVLVEQNPKYEVLVISMDLVKVEPKTSDFTLEFLYLMMKSRDFKEHCLGNSNGSTVLHLSKKAIPTYEFAVPPVVKISEFTAEVKPLIQKKFKNQSQIRTLTALRDTLLPKLMSGEVRVEM